MKSLLFATFALLSAAPALAGQPSIVGRWGTPGDGCSGNLSIFIQPLSLSSEDVTCTFTSVKRAGNTVTWHGTCDDAEGSAEQTVIATLNGKVLSFRYEPGGNVVTGLRRCK